MKQSIALPLLAVLLLFTGCCTAPRVTRWEYKVVEAPPLGFTQRTDPTNYQAKVEAMLNDLGKEGGILVSDDNEVVFYFRRAAK